MFIMYLISIHPFRLSNYTNKFHFYEIDYFDGNEYDENIFVVTFIRYVLLK